MARLQGMAALLTFAAAAISVAAVFAAAPEAICASLFLFRMLAFAAGAVLMVVGLIVGALARSRAALALAAAGLAIGLLPLLLNALPFADRCME